MATTTVEAAAEATDVGERLERLVDGDRAAAAWLYDTYAPLLARRLQGRYGGRPGIDVDDLLHDAFVFYFQNRARVLRDFLASRRPDEITSSRLERRLWDLACGLASNRRRAAKVREGTRALAEGEAERLSDGAVGERRAVDRDGLERLDACLRGADRRAALYYRLRFADGYTPREIAQMTGWTMKVTYGLRQRLDAVLRDCLERLGLSRTTDDSEGVAS